MQQPPDIAVNQRERICLRGFREKRIALVKLAEEYRSIRWGED